MAKEKIVTFLETEETDAIQVQLKKQPWIQSQSQYIRIAVLEKLKRDKEQFGSEL